MNFIVHKGDEKDTAEDRSFLPTEIPEAWLQSGDSTIHKTRGSAEDFAVIHYHRPDGDYGDATSTNYNDFWGVHTWAGHLDPDPEWTSPIKPAGTDRFGVFFQLDLDADATELAYILHRGDTKDPNPDQFLDLVNIGHEVWYLSGHTDADQKAKYLLPIQAGSGVDANLRRQKAHWLTENTHRLGHRATGRAASTRSTSPRTAGSPSRARSPAGRPSRCRGSRRACPTS